MDRKRPTDVYVGPGREAKRVKTEDGGGHFDIFSIPTVPRTAPGPSSFVIPKTESNGDYKPMGQKPNPRRRRSGRKAKNRPFVGRFVLVRRGSNWVRAHLNKRDMIVEFTVHYVLSAPWDLDEVEEEIFERLHGAHMSVNPIDEPGFLDDFIVDIEERLSTIVDSFVGHHMSGIVRLPFDGKLVMVNIIQGTAREVTYFGEVRPTKGEFQAASNDENTWPPQWPPMLGYEAYGAKIEVEARHVLAPRY